MSIKLYSFNTQKHAVMQKIEQQVFRVAGAFFRLAEEMHWLPPYFDIPELSLSPESGSQMSSHAVNHFRSFHYNCSSRHLNFRNCSDDGNDFYVNVACVNYLSKLSLIYKNVFLSAGKRKYTSGSFYEIIEMWRLILPLLHSRLELNTKIYNAIFYPVAASYGDSNIVHFSCNVNCTGEG